MLLLTSIATSGYLWKVSTQRELKMNGIEMEKESLLVEKGLLTAQLDQLKANYDAAMAENGQLKGSVETHEKAIAEKSEALAKLKKQQSSDRRNMESLKQDVQLLRSAKKMLEEEVATLQSENQALRLENERLGHELRKAKNENQNLGFKIEELTEQNHSLRAANEAVAPAGLRASAFRVEVERRNDKLTVKGSRARELNISFDLLEVPYKQQGVHRVYLSISDNRGTPLPGKNNKTVKVGTADKQMELICHQLKEVNITGNQRLAFVFPLDHKLAPGYYRAAIYTDEGWIGSVGFRVS